jgi:hypothetical protein
MNVTNRFAVIVVVVLSCTGCDPHRQTIAFEQKTLAHPNPTSFEFEAPIGDVKNAIKKVFGSESAADRMPTNQHKIWQRGGDDETKRSLSDLLQQPGGTLLWKGDADALADNVLTKPGNDNDAYLYGGVSPAGESQIYFKDHRPLVYFADFHIHLTSISSRKTRVEIFTFGSRVVTGLDKGWSPHGPAYIFVDVFPTTVEEYQILLGIGDQLRVTNMPPLEVPGPDDPIKELKLPRE